MSPSRFEELDKACRGITSRLADLAKKVSTPHAACLAAEAAGWQGNNRGGEALSFFEAGLVSAESVKDSYLTGRMYLGAAVAAFWSFDEDVERRRALLEKVAAYSAAAIEKLSIPPHDALGIAYLWHAESKTALAREVESEVDKKRANLRKAVEIAKAGTEFRKSFGAILDPGHGLSKALYFLALLEPEAEKRRLLEEALLARGEMVRINDLLSPD